MRAALARRAVLWRGLRRSVDRARVGSALRAVVAPRSAVGPELQHIAVRHLGFALCLIRHMKAT